MLRNAKESHDNKIFLEHQGAINDISYSGNDRLVDFALLHTFTFGLGINYLA
jgi:hypothetical protein